MDDAKESTFLTVLTHTVAQHGCRIASVDFESHVIDLEGPDEAVAACAEAIANLVDK